MQVKRGGCCGRPAVRAGVWIARWSLVAGRWSLVARRSKRRARAFGQPFGLPDLAAVMGWALAHHELHARPGFACSPRCLRRRARAFGQPCGLPDLAAVIGWALAHHELHARPGFACSPRCLRRRARAFGQPCGLPDLLLFAWPKRSRQEKGHPSSAPFAHPCAQGSRESVGVRGQAVPGLSRTSAASLRPPLRADPRTPAAPQGPRARARAPARKSRSGKREAKRP